MTTFYELSDTELMEIEGGYWNLVFPGISVAVAVYNAGYMLGKSSKTLNRSTNEFLYNHNQTTSGNSNQRLFAFFDYCHNIKSVRIQIIKQ